MHAELSSIYTQSATIDELLSDHFTTKTGQKSQSDQAALRLSAWCKASTSGDWSLFQKRLSRDQLTFDFVLGRFAGAEPKHGIEYPQWVHDSVWVMRTLCEPIQSGSTENITQETEIAFEQLFARLIEHAEQMLFSDLDERVVNQISKQTRLNLMRSLSSQISDIASPALFELFVTFRNQGKVESRTTAQVDQDQIRSDPVNGFYLKFIHYMQDSGFKKLIEAKPVLLRAMATLIRQWIDSNHELLIRLNNDKNLIETTFFNQKTQGPVEHIQGGLSDPHNSGRHVLILTFESGKKIVYKPKDCRLDTVWGELVERLNENGAPIILRAANVLSQKGYGWSEYIELDECNDLIDVSRYFERAGAWLVLLHLLGGNDMHDENILSFQDHPILIDIESILQASNPALESESPERGSRAYANKKTFESVLTVGLLPQYVKRPDNSVAAIGGMNPRVNDRMERVWVKVNTDLMAMTRVRAEPGIASNLPHLNGKPAVLGEHLCSFISGFQKYAKYLQALRDKNGSRWFCQDFTNLSTRKIVRPTAFYYALLQRVRDHRNMQDGVRWSAELDFVSRFSNWEKKEEPFWPITKEERLAMAELNIPVFFSATDRDELKTYGDLTISVGAIPGLEWAQARIDAFDDKEVEWQLQIVNATTSHLLTANQTIQDQFHEPLTLSKSELEFRNYFLDVAQNVARKINQLAITRGESSSWLGLDFMGDASVGQVTTLGFDLYNGAGGIAVFLSAMYKMTGQTEYKELALSALNGTKYEIYSDNAGRFCRGIGIGGATGLGSVIYILTTASNLLDDESLLDDAKAAARLMSDDLISSDLNLDVLAGVAGAILGILRLYSCSPEEWILDRAIKCGEHLLKSKRVVHNGQTSWASLGLGSLPLNGMSHGAAGFAFALAALASETGRQEFKLAAQECIDYENASFDASQLNWPDLREGLPAENKFKTCQWCNGAIGIGLARLASKKFKLFDSVALELHIDRSIQSAGAHPWGSIDSLCCGVAGGVELFSEFGRYPDKADFIEKARSSLVQVIERSKSTGSFNFGGGAESFNLGLFRGLAGIGYSALRQIDSDLPNVLIWE